jgi:hypothetical protein
VDGNINKFQVAITRAQATRNPGARRMGFWAGDVIDAINRPDAYILSPVNLRKLSSLYDDSTNLYLKFLPKFSQSLARIHGDTLLSGVGWEMIIGWWLAASLDILLVRLWEALGYIHIL